METTTAAFIDLLGQAGSETEFRKAVEFQEKEVRDKLCRKGYSFLNGNQFVGYFKLYGEDISLYHHWEELHHIHKGLENSWPARPAESARFEPIRTLVEMQIHRLKSK